MLKKRVVDWLKENNSYLFKASFVFWFLISSYFLFPISESLSLSKSIGVYYYLVMYYIGILLFFIAIFLSKKISININLFVLFILNIVLAVLFNKVKVVNFNYYGDSILRVVASFASLAFIRHAGQVNNNLKIYKNSFKMNQMKIYPKDIQKKVARGTYRYTTSDEALWIKSQDYTATIEYICSFFILFFVLLVSNRYLGFSTIFASITAIYDVLKPTWVLVDKDGNIL